MRKSYKKLSYLYPRSFINNTSQKLMYAGIDKDARELSGFIFVLSFMISTFASLLMYVFKDLLADQPVFLLLILTFIFVFLFIHILFLMFLSIIIDSRAKFVEDILPDVLMLISSNMRSGMIMYNALLLSARDEFKHFKKEIELAAKETLSGTTLEQALYNITERVDSQLLRRTVKLIIEGIESGGSMAPLLDNIAQDIQETRSLSRKIRASVLLYTTLFIIAACIGAPALFSISLFLVSTLAKFGGGMQASQVVTGISALKISVPTVNKGLLEIVSIASIAINAGFGALMVGLLEKEKVKRGLVLAPLFIIVALAVFFISRIVISNLFSTIYLI